MLTANVHLALSLAQVVAAPASQPQCLIITHGQDRDGNAFLDKF